MSDFILSVKEFMTSSVLGAEAIAKQATAAKRAAGAVSSQRDFFGACLTQRQKDTLNDAIGILQTMGEASATVARQRKASNDAKEKRRQVALKAVTQAFADVTDAGGLVVLLATSGSWRTHRTDDGLERIQANPPSHDAYAAKEIQTSERRDALEYYAWRIAEDGNDVTTEVAKLRATFDDKRAAIEAKHPALIQWLANAMTKKE